MEADFPGFPSPAPGLLPGREASLPGRPPGSGCETGRNRPQPSKQTPCTHARARTPAGSYALLCAHLCVLRAHMSRPNTHTHHRTHSPAPARDMESRTGKALGLQRPPPIPPQSCAGAASPRSCFSALGSLLPASESLENLLEAAEGPL